MTIITLNLWGGRLTKKIIAFLEKYKDTIDVFCFQETFKKGQNIKWPHKTCEKNIFEKIAQILNGHVGLFRPNCGEEFGLASFVRKGLHDQNLYKEYDVFVYKENLPYSSPKDIGRNVQIIKFNVGMETLNVLNFHGLWDPNEKLDSAERIEQSQKIIAELKTMKGNVVLCGDFNLRPDTKSLKMIEDAGLANLNKRFDILDTRTSHYPIEKTVRAADYVLVSPELLVKRFEKLPDEPSDHAPLLVEI